ncbi:MAG: type IX secretion system membrane protein PorP/SprF, partial [Bacteroidota bacterium]|nr:type IX secretion system membrane protein PorP/SprF [Bacteroidota bacterium]
MFKKLVSGCCPILFLIFLSFNSYAQQRTVYSQYMFNGLVLNPAYAGNQKQLSATGLYRKQWINLDGAPTSLNATVHAGFAKKKVGLGLMVTKEEIGVHNDAGVYLSYAYKVVMKQGVLSMGLQAGFNYLQSDFTKLSRQDPTDPILYMNINSFNPNFGSGIFYSTPSTYVGLSVPYILNNKIIDGESILSFAREYRYYFLTAGRVIEYSKEVKFKPSVLLRLHE